ncbi:tRNA guanosine(34) transglycosylase Tgt [Capillimicrobium parvum]|uniref:Queuine tRNA-ribosyltransferase n=1 Tax=Capillimicrobium parvum TaxID=2884022 RepID=A0A9E6XVL8_9ACTN|nr:tRNA guanosine(34) transglycosylase Tgt [Capillimicrobium parvum]UGS35224.1 Queuine tRNA-ribosyltransferase [Capillimicrobium parvum]
MISALAILSRDPGSQARAGVLRTAHGEVRTPAFVPLATKATVKGLEPRDVAGLGYDMVLGNTFHLFLEPGHERIARFGGLHRFMRWDGPIITDSGGFQVFSMGHGTVADEIKGRAPQGADRSGAILEIAEEGVRFKSYINGDERFMAPETSMEVQAALGSDLALVFDECTPFHATRDYTARSTERTHRWLRRCLDWHAEHGPPEQLVFGIVQGGVHDDLRRESTEIVGTSEVDGVAIGGSLGETKAQMHEVAGWSTQVLDEVAPDKPRHLLGIGEVDDLIRGVELGIDHFDCAMPTRIARHGMALVPDPERRWRVDLTGARFKDSDEPILDGCPCPCCAAGFSRGYLRYLLKARELTGMRLVTLHNLAFVSRLMTDLREAILQGTLREVAAALRTGAAPGLSRSAA